MATDRPSVNFSLFIKTDGNVKQIIYFIITQIIKRIMAINYKVSKCKNPKGVEGQTYYSGKAVKTGEYKFEDLARDINNSTTVTAADAMAVLKAMKSFIISALLDGRVVVLNDLGRL